MAIYLCRCPLLGIGFLEPLPHRKAKKQTWSKASCAELRMANLFAQVDDGGW
jgi:hypothetical protein